MEAESEQSVDNWDFTTINNQQLELFAMYNIHRISIFKLGGTALISVKIDVWVCCGMSRGKCGSDYWRQPGTEDNVCNYNIVSYNKPHWNGSKPRTWPKP